MVYQIRTVRKKVLTGTPIQNKLEGYFYIVNPVKPNFLGSLKDFKKLFIEPIKSGHYHTVLLI